MKHKNGLNDSDRLMVTVALWIALVSLFATSLTLPMLPSDVRNGVYTFNPETYSKYGNLFIVSASIIPVAIVLIVATLKKHNRMQHNFVSMIIFCIMLSVCMSGLTIYGICRQMVATAVAQPLDPYTMSAVAVTVLLSLLCAVLPRFLRRRKNIGSPFAAALCENLDRYWNFGAYGFMIDGIIVSFVPSAYAFIPLAIIVFVYGLMLIVFAKHKAKKNEAQKPAESAE